MYGQAHSDFSERRVLAFTAVMLRAVSAPSSARMWNSKTEGSLS